MKLNRICRLTLISAGMFILATILVSRVGAECAPDTCKPSGSAIGIYGTVFCGGSAVGAGIPVCILNQSDGTWSETCYTDTLGNYYVYPKELGSSKCPGAPNDTWSIAANQCPSTADCWVATTVSWDGASLVQKNLTLVCAPGRSCP